MRLMPDIDVILQLSKLHLCHTVYRANLEHSMPTS